jgi:hypothetical protein
LCVIFVVHSAIMSLFNVMVKNTSLAVSCLCSVFYRGVGSCGDSIAHMACTDVCVVPHVVIIRLPTVSTTKDLIKAVGCLRH